MFFSCSQLSIFPYCVSKMMYKHIHKINIENTPIVSQVSTLEFYEFGRGKLRINKFWLTNSCVNRNKI